MTEKDKKMLKNTAEEDLVLFHCNWAVNMRNEFGLWDGNDELLELCGESEADGASMAIIKAVWEALEGAAHGSHVKDYYRAPRWRLTSRCHGYTIAEKSDEGQDASLRIEMVNPE